MTTRKVVAGPFVSLDGVETRTLHVPGARLHYESGERDRCC
ncbi:hypothetical protein [Microbispora sp. GKU 823]|nr:hypothetical protein [Microbispora sp. GKU 823]